MISFHGKQEIKDEYLRRVRTHRRADELIKGTYWENGKGCAVGCTVHSSNHAAYETELGVPRILARLEDEIFENLPNELAMTWPERFLEAIPVGKDLSKVWPKFAIFLLTDATQCNSRHEQCSIVAERYQAHLNGEQVDWCAVRSAAAAAYAAAAAAAADDADDAAAYAAAYAADDADDAAAYAAADDAAAAAAAAAAAESRAFVAQSEKLLELLRGE